MNANRKIPATMVTQHPDHASKPHWHDSAFLTTHDEAEEAYRSFAELGATEYKWDWEGKLVDENGWSNPVPSLLKKLNSYALRTYITCPNPPRNSTCHHKSI